MVDTTIPGESAQIVTTNPNTPKGSAGVIAIVGRFQKGNGNTPIYITDAQDGFKKMGNDSNYPGSKILEEIFKKDPDNNNYGATGAIGIKAGVSAGATCDLMDTTTTPVKVMTLTVPGGTWGNSLTATISTGTLSGKKLVIKSGSTVLDVFDNCANATALYNKIISTSSLNIKVTTGDLTKTLKDVADSAFSSGTEVADPALTDLSDALDILINEEYDILIFTDVPEDSSYATIAAYLLERLANDKFTIAVLPIDSTKTVSQAEVVSEAIASGLLFTVTQSATVGTEELTDSETVARLAGALAGLPVNESLTNKIISDITGLNRTFTKDEIYSLTESGITVLELKSRKNNNYGVVSAVTTSQEISDDGTKTAWSEQYAVRTLGYVCNKLNMKDYLGSTGKSKTKSSIEGEISNRVNSMLEEGIAESIDVSTNFDEANGELLYIDVSVKPLGILKHIKKRVSMQE